MIFVCFDAGFAVCPEALAAAAVAIDERDIDGDASVRLGSGRRRRHFGRSNRRLPKPDLILESRELRSELLCLAGLRGDVCLHGRNIELQFCH